MKYKVTILQTVSLTIETDVETEDVAMRIGNEIVEKDRIPLDRYEMLSATVEVEKKDNIIPFPLSRKGERKSGNKAGELIK